MATDMAVKNMQLAYVGAVLQSRYAALQSTQKQSRFAKDGAIAFRIPDEIVGELRNYFSTDNEQPFDCLAVEEGYIGHDLPDEVVSTINQQNIYYGKPKPSVQNALEEYISSIAPSITEQLSYNFRVINIRAWTTKPRANYGPSNWHCDGYYEFFMPKLMLYINPPNIENGTIEFFTRDGRRFVLSSTTPTAILLDSSCLLHRGRSSDNVARPMIEITLAPDFTTDHFLAFPGQNGRFAVAYVEALDRRLRDNDGSMSPAGLATAGIAALTDEESFKCVVADDEVPAVKNNARCLNIGGGKSFDVPGWLNFDEFPPENLVAVKLTDKRPFPLPSSTMQLVYSSHCLEHLDTPSVMHCLSEAARVLCDGGPFVVKLPNFDAALVAYRNNDASFFAGHWGLEAIIDSWLSRGVPDTLAMRTSMLFCGFWNRAYGHAFTHERADGIIKASKQPRLLERLKQKLDLRSNNSDLPYHGPAVISSAKTRRILAQSSPKKISHDLVKCVTKIESDYTFNHQNAFSQQEFINLVETCGFNLVSTDTDEILQIHRDIPTLEVMKKISSYYLFRRSV